MTDINKLILPSQIPSKPNPIVLTPEQRAKLLGFINSNPSSFPSLKELTDHLYPGKNLDGRSFEGRAIKEYCATLNIKPKSSFNPKYAKVIELTEEQKLYIRNNANTMSPVEMGRALFNIPGLEKNGLEAKAIEEFLLSINVQPFDPNSVPAIIPKENKFIPKTFDQAARKVNKYVLNAIDLKSIKKDTRVQNYLQALIRYCHKTRYGLMIAVLSEGVDLELFESTFISNVWDKPDLSEEEIDQYINLCCDIVNYTKMQREIEKMSDLRDKSLDESDGKRLAMALVQQMGELYKEMDNNLKRQNATTKALIGTRNERLEGQRKGAASVSQLVESWRDSQKRAKLIAIAERRKQLIASEVERLDTLDSFKVEIFGLNKESFL